MILPTSDILFDAWAMTTIRGKLPGRPLVEPYLHGIRDWEPPETHVAWREEVGVITGELLEDLLDDYPLKPHELLRDVSSRVFDRLKKLTTPRETAVWIMSDDGSVEVTSLGALIDSGKVAINYKTILLPPQAGGLENGMLTAGSSVADDVADEWRDDKGRQRRVRVWDDDEHFEKKTKGMRLIRTVDTKSDADEDEDNESTGRRFWRWYEVPLAGDSDGSRSNRRPVLWQVHTDEVDPEPNGQDVTATATEVPRRFARLQRKYGRWGLAYLESLLRAADYAASAKPSETEDQP
jgi:CRISPR-associated endonuclease/helicase Cas3